jgi:hypothetical protein
MLKASDILIFFLCCVKLVPIIVYDQTIYMMEGAQTNAQLLCVVARHNLVVNACRMPSTLAKRLTMGVSNWIIVQKRDIHSLKACLGNGGFKCMEED